MSGWETPAGGVPKRKRSAPHAGGWEPWGATGGQSGVTRASSGPAMAGMTMVAASLLDCAVCFHPLKPPIFQCQVGHVVCSTCGDKLRAADKCHLCRVALPGGYRRCHAMEAVVEFARGPCPNAHYGCAETPVYHSREEHLLACLHAPSHCPGEACGFTGLTSAMLDHITSTHLWPCTRVRVRRCPFSPPNSLCLLTGFNFVVLTGDDYEDDNKYLFLLNVTRYPFCRAVSVIWIRSRGEAVKEIRFELSCRFWSNDRLISHNLKTEFRVADSDLSDGLPSNGCPQLMVPTTCDDRGAMEVNVEISINQTPDQRRFDTEEDMEDDEPDEPGQRL